MFVCFKSSFNNIVKSMSSLLSSISSFNQSTLWGTVNLLQNGCISNISFLSNLGVIFHWTMIMVVSGCCFSQCFSHLIITHHHQETSQKSSPANVFFLGDFHPKWVATNGGGECGDRHPSFLYGFPYGFPWRFPEENIGLHPKKEPTKKPPWAMGKIHD